MAYPKAADLIDLAGAPDEIEITPAMSEAGFAVLRAAYITDDLLEGDRETVSEIYRAMARARCRWVVRVNPTE